MAFPMLKVYYKRGRVIRFQGDGYNGASSCRVGLAANGSVSFDNFSIGPK